MAYGVADLSSALQDLEVEIFLFMLRNQLHEVSETSKLGSQASSQHAPASARGQKKPR